MYNNRSYRKTLGDDTPLVDAIDYGFLGFQSRINPKLLTQGLLQASQNMRIERGECQVRKGCEQVADDIDINDTPITLSFTLAEDVAVTSITRVSTTATVTAPSHGYYDGQRVEIRGATQTAYNGDVSINYVNANTFTYTVVGSPATPATGTIFANGGPVIEDTYGGGIFCLGIFKNPTYQQNKEWIVMAGNDSCYLWNQNESTQILSYPANEIIEPEDDVLILQGFNNLLILRSRDIQDGYDYQTVSALTQTLGTATATVTAHGYSTGYRIAIEGANQPGYLHEFDITVVDADTFTFTVDATTVSPATGTITARRVKPPLIWDGIHGHNFVKTTGGSPSAGPTYDTMRSTSIATEFNNQVVQCYTPYQDTCVISNVGNYNLYDPVFESFRANSGSDDTLIALHDFSESRILLFGRKSIYLVQIVLDNTGTTFDPQNTFIELLTSEVGCCARDTIVTSGAYVYFLSDDGVYRLENRYQDFKVAGVQIPLSDNIEDQFDIVNWEYVNNSKAVYFNNRYWLAVPTFNSEYPNAIFIYNIPNQQWETIDYYPMQFNGLVVSYYNGKRALFATNQSGFLFLLNYREDGTDMLQDGSTTTPVNGYINTREYTFGTTTRKRILRFMSEVKMDENSEITLTAITEEPDQTYDLGTLSSTTDEGFQVMRSVRAPAHGVSFSIATSAGRPTIRSVGAQAIVGVTMATRDTP
jgi:hypothetical protein